MGIEESYTAKKFFYCQDGVTWAQLPAVTPEMMADAEKIAAPGLLLSGDPSKEHEAAAGARSRGRGGGLRGAGEVD